MGREGEKGGHEGGGGKGAMRVGKGEGERERRDMKEGERGEM